MPLCRGIFKRTCELLRLNLETRADGLWRIPYVKEEFRSGNLDAAAVGEHLRRTILS